MVFNRERDDEQNNLEQAFNHSTKPKVILLLMRGGMERITLTEDEHLIIGRSDAATGFQPDVDLAQYHARKMGVSREHACLFQRGGQLYVTDMGSNNGTFVHGKLLNPHQPIALNDGDSMRLGMLDIRIEIR
jgi:pSer/pThr/pTyr-binding forkhead associated (FHA) protein